MSPVYEVTLGLAVLLSVGLVFAKIAQLFKLPLSQGLSLQDLFWGHHV